ncbi:MAG: ROK family protein [Deferribacteres bacterium]|nr:ROK family protein [Deferribacteres bacterium]
MKVVGVDVGGTQIKAAVFDLNGNMLKSTRAPTESRLGKERVLSNIVSVIEGLFSEDVAALGVAVASPLDPVEGILYYPPNLPGFGVFNIKSFLEERFGVSVVVDNDANLYAYGEWVRGAGRGAQVLLCVTVGTGIGGGLIHGGNIWHGAHGMGAEFGHITVDPDGPVCNCGNRGCLEAMASSYFLVGYVERRLREGVASRLAPLRGVLEPKLIYEAALEGDTLAHEAFAVVGKNLGVGLSSLINALDPDVVVVGGGLSKAGMILLEPVKKEIYARTLKGIRDRIRVETAVLGEFSAVYGAAYLAIKIIGGDR